MKKIIKVITLTLLLMTMANTTFAHEASKHMKNAEKPKCEAMSEMDMAKMDASDPVMMAMMKKCESSGEHHNDMDTSPAVKSKSECTQEHAEMGHCTMTDDKSTEKGEHENH